MGQAIRATAASKKTLKTGRGDVPIEVPRDRNGSFEPQLVKKGQRRFDGFDDKIISMYARGMSVREIQGLESTEGAKFWLKVMNEIRNRGVPGHSHRVYRWPQGLPGGH